MGSTLDRKRVRPSRAGYQAKRRTQSVTLYFKSERDLDGHREKAESAGYGHDFNGWLLQMVANGASGATYPPGDVERSLGSLPGKGQSSQLVQIS